MSDPQHSPLEGRHMADGAVMTDFAGWNMPRKFSSEIDEHHAVRSAAGCFDLSHMGQIEIHGPDAAAIADYAFASGIIDLPIGRARYTVMLNADGGIIDDLLVYRLAHDDLLVIANAVNRTQVNDELTRRAEALHPLRATITDRTQHRSLIAVQGPLARDILQPLMGSVVDELRPFRCHQTSVDLPEETPIPALFARTGYTGEDGFELSVPAGAAAHVWQAIRTAGQPHGLLPCGLAARDTLRLEAGMALYGQELTPSITPAQAGLGWTVHSDHEFFGKSALGQEAEPAMRLIGLTGAGRRAARAGNTVHVGGESIGTITSGVLSPTLGHPIALARCAQPLQVGTDVTVDVRGTDYAMTVVDPPFYRRPRVRR